MDDQLALLAAVLEFPEQDAPRLIYADWLDEHGDAPRAEFIRVSVELAWRPYSERRTAHYRDLLVRFRALVAAHRAAWVAPFTTEPTRVLFRRGFIEVARLMPAEVLRIEDAALALEPLFELEVFGPPPWTGGAPPDGDAAVRRLAAWPGRGRFRKVWLSGLTLSYGALAELTAAPVAARARPETHDCRMTGSRP
jgi:uncharacterized protein (TIGR02996 family)